MKAYNVKGTMVVGRKLPKKQPFSWQVAANDPQEARDFVFSEIGSKHGITRKKIKVENVEELPEEEVTNPRVINKLQKAGK